MVIFNLGGSSLEVSIFSIDGEEIKVDSTDGDNRLGGEDFTAALLDHCVTKFEDDMGI